VLALLGGRLLAVDEAPEWFAEAVARDAWLGRASAMAHEALLSRVQDALSPFGIRAVPLKGIALSHIAHGDAGIRRTSDLDVLVAPDRFEEAVGRLEAAGLERGVEPLDRYGRPGLHQLLIAPDMPPLELHWRIHWYEERFAGDAVARSVADEALGWRLSPADDLVALLLFYARDGFTGLRFPADIAAWLDRHAALVPADALATAARAYPELAAAIVAASWAVCVAIDEDRLARPPVHGRTRLAVGLTDPAMHDQITQIYANAALVNLLLTPAGQLASGVRRHLAPSLGRLISERPELAEQPPRVQRIAQALTPLRVGRRWGLALGRLAAAGRRAPARHRG
jgi:hypothetical protein